MEINKKKYRKNIACAAVKKFICIIRDWKTKEYKYLFIVILSRLYVWLYDISHNQVNDRFRNRLIDSFKKYK